MQICVKAILALQVELDYQARFYTPKIPQKCWIGPLNRVSKVFAILILIFEQL